VTEADIAAARARVDEARARLNALQGAPNNDQLTAARSALTEAQAALERQRSALSAAKLDAERQVFERANRLRDAQTAFAAARDNLARVEADGKDPLTGAPLSDAGKRTYADAFAQAERALADAELALNQARIAYETARQNEITGLAEAEARVATAQANLDALLNPNPDRIAAARAALAQSPPASGSACRSACRPKPSSPKISRCAFWRRTTTSRKARWTSSPNESR
jgi:DNA repair exonuclease SbcCD ATPase subunit